MISQSARRLATFVALCAVGALLGACATTRLTAQWRNPEFASHAVNGPILVVGMTRDDARRRLYEDAMVKRLAADAVVATASYTVVPESLSDASSDTLLQAARDAGAGAVLSSAVIDRQVVSREVIEPYPLWNPAFDGWYHYYWPQPSVSHVENQRRYVASTSLTDTRSGKVIWAGETTTEAPLNVERELRAFADKIVDSLETQGLV